jgi:hypothetical protein
MDFKEHIRAIPDFPKPGILFYDISTLLAHPQAWRATVEQLAAAIRPHKPDLLVGIESRGFPSPHARHPARFGAQEGKLPAGLCSIPMISNTAPIRSRCSTMRSHPVNGSSSSMI